MRTLRIHSYNFKKYVFEKKCARFPKYISKNMFFWPLDPIKKISFCFIRVVQSARSIFKKKIIQFAWFNLEIKLKQDRKVEKMVQSDFFACEHISGRLRCATNFFLFLNTSYFSMISRYRQFLKKNFSWPWSFKQ